MSEQSNLAMPYRPISDYTFSRPQTRRCFRQGVLDRSSLESDSSVPSMVDDHGSDSSVEEIHDRQVTGEDLWDSFWLPSSDVVPSVPQKRLYPALVAPAQTPFGLPAQQFLQRRRTNLMRNNSTKTSKAAAGCQVTQPKDLGPSRTVAPEPSRSSYTAFSNQPDVSRYRPVRLPPVTAAATPSCSNSSLRGPNSTRDLRSGSASSAFSSSSGYSVSTQSQSTAITTPGSTPPTSPATPKPNRALTTCPPQTRRPLDTPRANRQPSVPHFRGPARYRPLPSRSISTPQYESHPSHQGAPIVVGHPQPLVTQPPPLPRPQRQAPLPPLPRSALSLRRPPQTELQELLPAHLVPAPLFSGRDTPTPWPQILPEQPQPPLVSVFEWDTDPESESEDSRNFAKRFMRGLRGHHHQRDRQHREKRGELVPSQSRQTTTSQSSVDGTGSPKRNGNGSHESDREVEREKAPVLKRQGSAFFGKILGRRIGSQ